MADDVLQVYFRSSLAGTIRLNPAGQFTFQYDPAWLASEQRFAISLSLPLSDEAYEQEQAHFFFSNLLPEGSVRGLIAKRLGISEDNDFALLKAIGGECAGALSIVPDGPALPEHHAYRPLPASELERIAGRSSVFPFYTGTDGIRLSLAGAQDKLPVYIDEEGRFHLPLGSSPSTHILKFHNRDFKHLPANETFFTMLARNMGLPTVNVRLHDFGKQQICVAERYDRVRNDHGRLVRIHQEDLCQALGAGHRNKYEEEGGPSFVRCFNIVRTRGSDPMRDANSLLRWTAFNVIAGNSDGHAKNLSLLYRTDGSITLAPFYDLVCTRIYKMLDRNLAMRVGGERDPGWIKGKHWRVLANELDIKSDVVFKIVKNMAEMLPDAAERTAAQFRDLHGDSPVLKSIAKSAGKQSIRTLRLLEE